MNLGLALACLTLLSCSAVEREPQRPPNVIWIVCDDLGYGDLRPFGNPSYATPHLDRLARQGTCLNSFHVAQASCTPSRTALLTGCYNRRLSVDTVYGPATKQGLHPDEQTMAELLKDRGYATAAIGKWHLGSRPEWGPLAQGFDSFFGLLISNDMWPFNGRGEPRETPRFPPLCLQDGEQMTAPITDLAGQGTLTERYTERALQFIDQNQTRPFFLYLAHSMPHVPLASSAAWQGRGGGPYGDVIVELDDSTGRILQKLEQLGLADDTLLVFTSDNGPWLNYGNHAGSSGGLRSGKGTVWQGGIQVPCILHWPGRVPAGQQWSGLAAAMDLLPTTLGVTGASAPRAAIDGVDLLQAIVTGGESPRTELLCYYEGVLCAVRRGQYKLVLPHGYRCYEGHEPGRDALSGPVSTAQAELALYDLQIDPGETRNLAGERPDLVASLQGLAQEARRQLGDRGVRPAVIGAQVRPAARVD